jgi:hypothetical protein
LTTLKRLRLAPTLAACGLLGIGAVHAHPGGLDANGCHYDRSKGNDYHCHKQTSEISPNPDINAGAKKSRENICHDKSSPNYRQLRYFVAYRDMDACLVSGGIAYRR